MRNAINIICQNINSSGFYPWPWDEKKKWDSYGIKVVGDRDIIDNPPALPAPKKEVPPPALPVQKQEIPPAALPAQKQEIPPPVF